LRIAASQLQLLAHCLDLIDVQPRIAFCPQRSTGPQEDDYQYVDPLEIFFIFYFLERSTNCKNKKETQPSQRAHLTISPSQHQVTEQSWALFFY